VEHEISFDPSTGVIIYNADYGATMTFDDAGAMTFFGGSASQNHFVVDMQGIPLGKQLVVEVSGSSSCVSVYTPDSYTRVTARENWLEANVQNGTPGASSKIAAASTLVVTSTTPMDSLMIIGNVADDTAEIPPSTNTVIRFDGGANPEAQGKILSPGDSLIVDAQGSQATDTGSEIQVAGFLPVGYSNVESVVVLNALPVELIAFEALVRGRDVHLSWATASEENNAGFEVQRREPGGNAWRPIGFVDGSRESTVRTSYGFTVKLSAQTDGS
jgi:hypothetical protein